MGRPSSKSGKLVPSTPFTDCIRKSAYLKKHNSPRLMTTEESSTSRAARFPLSRSSSRPWT